MAADGSIENFQGRAIFFVLGDFLKSFFFFQNIQHKMLFQDMQLAFFSYGDVAPESGPKVKKVGYETKKTTVRLE